MSDAEMYAIFQAVEAAGLVEVYEEDGQQIMRLTAEGEKVAQQMAMTDEDGQDVLVKAPLGETPK